MSESAPKRGNRKIASTLSIAIITPDTVSLTAKVFFRINGTMLSYNCQKEQIDKNASPTRIVRLVFSFIGTLLYTEPAASAKDESAHSGPSDNDFILTHCIVIFN